MSARNFCTLSEALSWIAFGLRVTSEDLESELMGESFGYPYSDAKARLEAALKDLMTAVHAGQVEAQGRFHTTADSTDGALTRILTSAEARDYRAFDISCDGLRYGEGLLWLPEMENDEISYVQSPLLRFEYFSDVVVSFPALKQAGFKQGTSPSLKQAVKPTISAAAVKDWFDSLPKGEQRRSQKDLCDACNRAFPQHKVPRKYVRELTRGRPRGRPRAQEP